MEHIMTLHNVSASYDGREVLSDLSLDIPARRITAVIGPSGCGKTTLLRCMNGLLAEEKGVSVSGRILLDGQDKIHAEGCASPPCGSGVSDAGSLSIFHL